MVDVTNKILDALESRMTLHKMNCHQAFHRHCREFILLARQYVNTGGVMRSFNPFDPDLGDDSQD